MTNIVHSKPIMPLWTLRQKEHIANRVEYNRIWNVPDEHETLAQEELTPKNRQFCEKFNMIYFIAHKCPHMVQERN